MKYYISKNQNDINSAAKALRLTNDLQQTSSMEHHAMTNDFAYH